MTSAKSEATPEIDLVELSLAIIDEATMAWRLAAHGPGSEISGEPGVADPTRAPGDP
jgi:hypothetical protein